MKKSKKFEKAKFYCESCGYAVSNLNTKNIGMNNNTDEYAGNIFRKKRFVESGLPIWVYIICIVVLVILVIGLYSCL